MPNWCENRAVICGSKDKLDKLERAVNEQIKDQALNTAGVSVDFLNTILPLPDYLRNAETSNTISVTDRVDWKYENWGTIYTINPVFNRKDDQTLELSFQSASSPPLQAYKVLVNDWALQVRALYFEFRMGFAGIYENGKLQHYRSERLEDVLEFPSELHKVFGIKAYYGDYFNKEMAK